MSGSLSLPMRTSAPVRRSTARAVVSPLSSGRPSRICENGSSLLDRVTFPPASRYKSSRYATPLSTILLPTGRQSVTRSVYFEHSSSRMGSFVLESRISSEKVKSFSRTARIIATSRFSHSVSIPQLSCSATPLQMLSTALA